MIDDHSHKVNPIMWAFFGRSHLLMVAYSVRTVSQCPIYRLGEAVFKYSYSMPGHMAAAVSARQMYNKLGTASFLASAPTAWTVRSRSRNYYLGHPVGEPDELGCCFDFTLGNTSGMK